jgi:hypothetical protein
MKKKIIAGILFIGVLGAFGAYYLFNMPHRDIQSSKTDFSLSSTQLVNEYLRNPDLANEKYLQEEGDSKILAVTGTVFSIGQDQNSQKVVLLKDPTDKAGVSCTFTLETNKNVEKLKVGQTISVKGVIRSGAGFDKDLDLYEDVILEKCDIIHP